MLVKPSNVDTIGLIFTPFFWWTDFSLLKSTKGESSQVSIFTVVCVTTMNGYIEQQGVNMLRSSWIYGFIVNGFFIKPKLG